MPHIRLEYSSNIKEKHVMEPLFKTLHSILEEQLPTKLHSCKSRAIECSDYLLGDGKTLNAFIHVELKTTKGKSKERLNKTAEMILELLNQHFKESKENLKLEISLEIVELTEHYHSPWTLPK